MAMDSGQDPYKWISKKKLIELLEKLPDSMNVTCNRAGNLTLCDGEKDNVYVGFIDLKNEVIERP